MKDGERTVCSLILVLLELVALRLYAKMNRIAMVRKQMCFVTTVKVLGTRNARDLWL